MTTHRTITIGDTAYGTADHAMTYPSTAGTQEQIDPGQVHLACSGRC